MEEEQMDGVWGVGGRLLNYREKICRIDGATELKY